LEITSEKVFKGKDSFAPEAIPPNFHPPKGGRNVLPLHPGPGGKGGVRAQGEMAFEKILASGLPHGFAGDLSGSLFSRENEPSSISSRRAFEGAAAFLIREGSS
jgi:hypothetical protein